MINAPHSVYCVKTDSSNFDLQLKSNSGLYLAYEGRLTNAQHIDSFSDVSLQKWECKLRSDCWHTLTLINHVLTRSHDQRQVVYLHQKYSIKNDNVMMKEDERVIV